MIIDAAEKKEEEIAPFYILDHLFSISGYERNIKMTTSWENREKNKKKRLIIDLISSGLMLVGFMYFLIVKYETSLINGFIYSLAPAIVLFICLRLPYHGFSTQYVKAEFNRDEEDEKATMELIEAIKEGTKKEKEINKKLP